MNTCYNGLFVFESYSNLIIAAHYKKIFVKSFGGHFDMVLRITNYADDADILLYFVITILVMRLCVLFTNYVLAGRVPS